MKRTLLTLLAVFGCLVVLGAQPALAQYPFQTNTNPQAIGGPRFSPYINLFRPGGTPIYNYNYFVKPQIEFNNAIQQLQRDSNKALKQLPQEAPPTESVLPPTGKKAASFQTQNRYYSTGTTGIPTTGRTVTHNPKGMTSSSSSPSTKGTNGSNGASVIVTPSPLNPYTPVLVIPRSPTPQQPR